ncbi:hypothetical protein PF007_g18242 [Phytophthora fragariae]|uniref:Uncharacterized protein n=1 Tax=Phytophthora fragariae TaxID=53985 RepID=A0A6A3RB24_9STRA|nr:hypothetical protein PF003_g36376 [Phytophthora fragariae]KAE9093084.1 hypothetical protein PF007_g18242 [Phytophthora fragariae]KAE9300316.1 hypothetical protein PF008_g23027 [Phytophthora fragariae]
MGHAQTSEERARPAWFEATLGQEMTNGFFRVLAQLEHAVAVVRRRRVQADPVLQ